MNNLFKIKFLELLEEDNTSGLNGVWGNSPDVGSHGGAVGNSDWYATGDSRNLFGNSDDKKTNKKKKAKKKKSSTLLPLQKRNHVGL